MGSTWGGGQKPGCWDFMAAGILVILAMFLHLLGS